MGRRVAVFAFVALLWCVVAAPGLAGGVAVLGVSLSDNGDDDGYADTGETVNVRLIVRNLTGERLTGVRATLSRTLHATACLTVPEVEIGDLEPDERRVTEGAFQFVVPPNVERTELAENLSVTFDVAIASNEVAALAGRQTLTFDLDLDITGGTDPTVFFEHFEGGAGLGQFTAMNLDFGLFDPDTSDGGGPSAGYRCQYATGGSCASCAPRADCSPGASPAHADRFHWQLDGPGAADGGRAYSGLHSLYMGIELPDGERTTPLAVLEAVRTRSPIHLGQGKTCSDEPTRDCAVESDCPAGQTCVDATPALTFKHQISLVDSRLADMTPGEAIDRGVVQVLPVDAQGNALGDWIKIEPWINVYDQQGTDDFLNCTFDPVDDGSDEFDRYPIGPDHGPSSTCKPEFVFAHLGDTGGPFDPGLTGNASEGPGLAGSSGRGTWVESYFDLSRFRGRSVLLRFLNAGMRVGALEHWEALFGPSAGDDGWWIDDVGISHTRLSAGIVTVDTQDNSDLPSGLGDADQDGVLDTCDNCPDRPNPTQRDDDRDLLGDACDRCPRDPLNDLDADGVCPSSDNCPSDFNPDQSDADDDSWGDVCDNCPLHSNPNQDRDSDRDGTPCPDDNCPFTWNADQADDDGDGTGEACDACPGDSSNDPDEDDVCAAEDTCPTAPNPGQGLSVRLALGAGAHALGADRSTLIFVGKPTGLDAGLYRLTTPRGSPVKLFAGASRIVITADDSTAVVSFGGQLYSVPIFGGDPLRLAAHDGAYFVSPDGSHVVFFREDTMFSVPLTGGPAVELAGPLASGPRFSPDGTRVVFVLREGLARLPNLFSVAVDGGVPVKLSSIPRGRVLSYGITPDGRRLIYLADQDRRWVNELYSVPVAGGNSLKISELTRDGWVQSFSISPDGERVAYRADADGDNVLELYTVGVAGGPVTRLDSPDAKVFVYRYVPDGSRVVYSALTDRVELFAVPAAGGSVTKLAGFGGSVSDFRVSPTGDRVVARQKYCCPERRDLFSTPIDGGTPTRLSEPRGESSRVDRFAISGDGTRVLYWQQEGFSGPLLLYRVPITGASPTLLSDGLAVADAAEASDESVVYFWSRDALYASWPDHDPDGDGIHLYCDNCPDLANPAQEDADGDGFGLGCDCDDDDPETYPGAPQLCDGINNDCSDPAYPELPPDEFLSVTTTPSELWPPDHRLVDVRAVVSAGAVCAGAPIVLHDISSDQPGGEDDIQEAEHGTADFDFRLRAERAGRGAGRVYRVVYSATGDAGRTIRDTATVTVPHDRRPPR